MKGPSLRPLEEMDGREAQQFLAELASRLSPGEEYKTRHEDYVMEVPQSGECYVGRESMRAFQEAFPGNSNAPSIRMRRGGRPYFAALLLACGTSVSPSPSGCPGS